MRRKITLYGELGKKFGSEYIFNVSSPADAMRALCSQIKGFKKYLLDSAYNGIEFRIFVRGSEIGAGELALEGPGDYGIAPEIMGANAEFRFFAGAALIAAGAALGAFSGGAATPGAVYLANAGIALAAGGALEYLARGLLPTEKPYESPENTPSFAFAGAINTSAQGQPVPICYGEMEVGGQTISASLSTHVLSAGYEYQLQEDFVLINAIAKDTNYTSKPPTNYTRRELIAYHPAPVPANPYGPGWPWWEFKFYYMKPVLVLRNP